MKILLKDTATGALTFSIKKKLKESSSFEGIFTHRNKVFRPDSELQA